MAKRPPPPSSGDQKQEARDHDYQVPLWLPTRNRPNAMDRYREHVNATFKLSLRTTQELQRWSVGPSAQTFWTDLYGYLGLVPTLPSNIKHAYDDTVPMSGNPEWFPGLRINYAENVLANVKRNPDGIALIGIRESIVPGGEEGERVTWRDLTEQVRAVQSALRRSGLKQGDRVAALVGNSVWAVVLFLAVGSMGAIFSSIAPDLGIEGCVSRLEQIHARFLFVDGDATYKGKIRPTATKVTAILNRLGTAKPMETIVIPKSPGSFDRTTVNEFLKRQRPDDKLTFARVLFNKPLVIVYSSGTTGTPKCIVHHHGIILNLKKVSHLHNNLTSQDVVLQYSSTSWIMFYIMNGHLAAGATTILYDGSPLWPDARSMLRILERHKVTYYGTSPRYLLELEINKIVPKREFDLSLRMVNVTGSSLATSQYHWFYNNFPAHIHLCNVAGGTDTVTSHLAGDPCGPLVAGEMQTFALGMDIDVADPASGASIRDTGRPGEMVIRKPFASMPAFFWGDDGGRKYRESYFDRFESVDVWAQHDWITYNPATGGVVMSGRSDGVLNPSGIRFGSGEIYAITEGPAFNSEIADTLCVGRRRPGESDEAVFLFVKMLPSKPFTESLRQRLRDAIVAGLSSRHAPSFILPTDDIPVTVNGKKVEVAVKRIISGTDVTPSATVANPECLLGFKKFRDVEHVPRAKL